MTVDILLDVGGTGIRGAACPPGGAPGDIRAFPSRSGDERDALIRHFRDLLLALADGAAIRRVAMAFPGPFDYALGVPLMRGLAKYEALYGVSLPDALTGAGVRAKQWRFINDVSAYALGAAAELADASRIMAVCLGTGAGSAFLAGGALTTDRREGVPENGWIYALPYRDSIVDDYLSDRGIRRLSRALLGAERSARELNGDSPSADAVWAAFGADALAALSPVIAAFRPTDLVLGGGISRAWSRFGAPLAAYCESERVRVRVEPDVPQMVMAGLKRLISD